MMLMTITAPSSSPPQSSSSSYPKPLFPIFTTTVASSLTTITTCKTFNTVKTKARTRSTIRWAASSTDNQKAVEVPETTTSPSLSLDAGEYPSSSLRVVRNFYGGINAHDLASVEELIAHHCIYEDLIFSQPFVGRKAILDFFQKFIDSISMDLQFVIDDISEEDTSALGVTWHLEWKGKPFPFSKGCSFYRLEVVNGKRQIVYGRDSVEPAIKPGEMALLTGCGDISNPFRPRLLSEA